MSKKPNKNRKGSFAPAPSRVKENSQPAAHTGLQSGPTCPDPMSASVTAGLSDDLEPRAESAAVPVWLFVLMFGLIYWGMLHLDNYGGGFNAMVYGPYRSYKQLSDLQPRSGPEMLVARGESVYAMVCVACHMASGQGSPGQYPPLAGSEWVTGPASHLIRIPLHGLTGPIEVRGESWNLPGLSMPAFGGTPPLDNDEDLAAVLSYIRQAWGNQAPPITPEQVRAVRAETASRAKAWTAEELSKVPDTL